MKKIIKVTMAITLLFSITFLGSVKVKADDSFNFSKEFFGKVGTGGTDPCLINSYLCIYNLAAVRVSLYEGTEFKVGMDIYQKGAKGASYLFGGNKNATFITKLNRNGKKVIDKEEEYDLSNGFPKISFVSDKLQKKFYSAVKNGFKSKTSKVYNGIIEDLVKKANISYTELNEYINEHEVYVVIEPLYLAQIQTAEDVWKNTYGTKGYYFDFYIGTSYDVAHLSADTYFKKCKPHSGQDCYDAYKSRKDKGHVSRLANSFTISDSIKKPFVISGTSRAKLNATRLEYLDDRSIGYGIAVVRLRRNGNPPENPPEVELPESKCYSYKEDDDCSGLTITKTISTGEEVGETADCNEAQNKTNSQYGKDYGAEFELANNKYCSVYCTSTTSYDMPREVNGMINFNHTLATEGNSEFYLNNFSIVGKASMTCKFDFKYWYHSNATDQTNQVTWVSDMFGSEALVTMAEHDIAIAYHQYKDQCSDATDEEKNSCLTNGIPDYSKDGCSKSGTHQCGYLNAIYIQTGISIKKAYEDCWKTDLNDKIEEKIQLPSPTVYSSHTKSNIEVKQDNVDTQCTGCAGESKELVNDEKCGGSCYDKYCSGDIANKYNENTSYHEGTEYEALINKYKLSLPCQINAVYQPIILNRGEFEVDKTAIFVAKNKIAFDINKNEDNSSETNDGDESDFNEQNGTKITRNKELYCSQTLTKETSGNNDNKELSSLATEINISFPELFPDGVCKDKSYSVTTDYSTANITCPCPKETYHAGTNAYFWGIQNLLGNDQEDFNNNGINCASAIEKYCNNTALPETKRMFEPILSEDGTHTLDACLASGIQPAICSNESSRKAFCKNEYNKFDITEKVYEEIKKANKDEIDDTVWDDAVQKVRNNYYFCTCDDNDISGKKDFMFRTISLSEKKKAFPGFEGRGRTPGFNWNNDGLIKRIITDTKDVYKEDPMYHIVLDYNTIQSIRTYNNQNGYDDFKMSCGENNAACVSTFLNDTIKVSGKCADVSTNVESFYGKGCVNHEGS